MMFIACTKHSDKNFLGISSCDTLSSPLRQELLFLTDETIWGSESRSCISNYQESAGVTRERSEQALQMRNPDASAIHVGIKKWLITFTFHFHALEKEMATHSRDGGAWWAAVYEVAQSQTQLTWLSSSSSRQKINYNLVKNKWEWKSIS